MAKIIITFEDSPEGVIVSANGARIPAERKTGQKYKSWRF